MIIVNGKIRRCTELELFQFWILQWSDLLDFETYKRRCIRKGVMVDEWRDDYEGISRCDAGEW